MEVEVERGREAMGEEESLSSVEGQTAVFS